MFKLNHKKRIAALVAMATLLPVKAYAQLEPVENAADTILAFMTGTFATVAGAVAIAMVGYRWFTGRMELGRALTIAGGIVLVLGAVRIVEFISTGIA
ncbi:MAG: TrbC/VirB2 family protein [Litorimonas sp.]